MLGCDSADHERKQSTSGLPKACDPAYSACQDPPRQDSGCLIDGDRVHWAEEDADDGDGHCVLYERGHEPDGKFEAANRLRDEREWI